MIPCAGCQYLMVGRWAPWCHKAGAPLLAVKRCPCPRERQFFEPLDVLDMVEKARGGGPMTSDNFDTSDVCPDGRTYYGGW